MKRRFFPILLLLIPLSLLGKVVPQESRGQAGYVVQTSYLMPGTPEFVWDTITGDVTSWVTRGFSDSPKIRRLDPFPGGMFVEEFQDEPDGVRYGKVIVAERPKLIRIDGPFGFGGKALDMVESWSFASEGDSTRMTIEIHLVGEVTPEMPAMLEAIDDGLFGTGLKAYLAARLEEK